MKITVLDISANTIERAKQRLGNLAQKVKWIVSDIIAFHPDAHYDIWHDRATLHFLTSPEEIKKYTAIAKKSVKSYLVLGTFSENGPKNVADSTLSNTIKTLLLP